MKRMSDVFNLPVLVCDLRHYLDNDINADTCATNAINHVDGLADALDECIENMELEGMNDSRVYILAARALKAYRGEK